MGMKLAVVNIKIDKLLLRRALDPAEIVLKLQLGAEHV